MICSQPCSLHALDFSVYGRYDAAIPVTISHTSPSPFAYTILSLTSRPRFQCPCQDDGRISITFRRNGRTAMVVTVYKTVLSCTPTVSASTPQSIIRLHLSTFFIYTAAICTMSFRYFRSSEIKSKLWTLLFFPTSSSWDLHFVLMARQSR